MKRSRAAMVICFFLLLGLLASATMLVVGCDPTGTTQMVEQGKQIEQKALDAASQANLKMIDSAIQVYYAENEEWPTSISQLTQYFGGKIPTDPSGKTYYIQMVNGQAKAAVK